MGRHFVLWPLDLSIRNFAHTPQAGKKAHGRKAAAWLEPAELLEEHVSGEQKKQGAAPDVDRGFPVQLGNDLPLAAPGDEKAGVIFTTHEHSFGMRIEGGVGL